MKRTAVIMAGGSGERFWPLSRKNKPKQLLSLVSDKTMLEEAIERISPLIKPEDIFIITGKQLIEPIRNVLKTVPKENIVAEPFKRNTAPCLALAASVIEARYSAQGFLPKDISIAVLTADQNISPNELFIKTVESAYSYVENNNTLCTIGIIPSRPETGYGYIELEAPFNNESKISEIKKVVKFHEKPTVETALNYINKGNYLWNSGMFFWRLDVFKDEMTIHLAEVGDKISVMAEIFKNNDSQEESLRQIAPIFEVFPDISIDYGLMEKSSKVSVAKALFEWDDVGSWDSLERIKEIDENGNIIQGKATFIDSKNTTVINNSTNNKILVTGIGLNDFVIVTTDDSILICPKNRVQEVKKVVQKIRDNNDGQWL